MNHTPTTDSKNSSEEYIYRHCEGGVGGADDNESHWKCAGTGDAGDCGCQCHNNSSVEDWEGLWAEFTNHIRTNEEVLRFIQHIAKEEYERGRSSVIKRLDPRREGNTKPYSEGENALARENKSGWNSCVQYLFEAALETQEETN